MNNHVLIPQEHLEAQAANVIHSGEAMTSKCFFRDNTSAHNSPSDSLLGPGANVCLAGNSFSEVVQKINGNINL